MIYEDNAIYVDINNLEHKMVNPKKRIRLYLGEFVNDEFTRTVETIKLLTEDEQKSIKNYLKSVFNI